MRATVFGVMYSRFELRLAVAGVGALTGLILSIKGYRGIKVKPPKSELIIGTLGVMFNYAIISLIGLQVPLSVNDLLATITPVITLDNLYLTRKILR